MISNDEKKNQLEFALSLKALMARYNVELFKARFQRDISFEHYYYFANKKNGCLISLDEIYDIIKESNVD